MILQFKGHTHACLVESWIQIGLYILQCFNDCFSTVCRAAFCTLLKMSKLLLTVVGYAQVTVVAEAIQPCDPSCSPPSISASAHNAAVILQQALQYIPNPGTECMLRNMAVRLAGHLSSLVSIKKSTLHDKYGERNNSYIVQAGKFELS